MPNFLAPQKSIALGQINRSHPPSGQILFPTTIGLITWRVNLETAGTCAGGCQNIQGIGGNLVQAGLKIADNRGEELVVVLGHAHFYSRFGFQPATN
ncbi:MAG: hypothetical protein DSM107014_06050 [Gomphosphaeria aponina SAG 52.96 = DSM 107014]|uniref:Uncharacterized protein n=1 Tax=Gomphosphaeria aponina SAG 52.96 = DSM 107014 TaxID=1521640 RepID=A0A941JPD6_9CHRO|nr:hypothetical protein [Gomphosphaeria aponina SAG 52.96 = DSM 107014]